MMGVLDDDERAISVENLLPAFFRKPMAIRVAVVGDRYYYEPASTTCCVLLCLMRGLCKYFSWTGGRKNQGK